MLSDSFAGHRSIMGVLLQPRRKVVEERRALLLTKKCGKGGVSMSRGTHLACGEFLTSER